MEKKYWKNEVYNFINFEVIIENIPEEQKVPYLSDKRVNSLKTL